MRRLGFAALIAAGMVVMGHAVSRKVDFSQDAVDQPPKGFEFGHTAGVGRAGKCAIALLLGVVTCGAFVDGLRWLF
jgi:hypothetical protein